MSETTPPVVLAMPFGGTVAALACGGQSCCAANGAGALACWGGGAAGQLGRLPVVESGLPALVDATPPIAAAQVAVGGSHACALTSTGAPYCWGYERFGQLGVASNLDHAVPQPVVGIALQSIALGARHSCGIDAAGGIYCWGDNTTGQLGNGEQRRRHVAQEVPDLPAGTVLELALGPYHSCALLRAATGGDEEVYCWGYNAQQQLGQPSPVADGTPRRVDLLPPVDGIASGSGHGCSQQGGLVSCWGSNWAKQLGSIGASTASPRPVVGLPAKAKLLTMGQDHSCALGDDKKVWCWGRNDRNQLGVGLGAGATSVVPLSPALPWDVTALSCMLHGCCAVGSEKLRCWGDTQRQALGHLTDGLWQHPGLDAQKTSAVGLGLNHGCALDGGNVVRCWGESAQGRLGNDTSDGTSNLKPVDGLTAPTELAVGGNFTCVLDNGDIKCWGDNGAHELGTPDYPFLGLPVVIGLPGGQKATAIAAGQEHACAIVQDRAYCWGSTAFGQCGGPITDTRTPQPVLR